MQRNKEKGFTFIEMIAVLVIIGVMAVATVTAVGYFRVSATGHLVQTAMAALAADQANGRYPVSVTISDLRNSGVGSLIDDYVINSYTRTGTPVGKDYKLEIEAVDIAVLCVTSSTLTRAACL